MTQCLRAYTALAEDLSSGPGPMSRAPMSLASLGTCTHMHTPVTYIDIQLKIKAHLPP